MNSRVTFTLLVMVLVFSVVAMAGENGKHKTFNGTLSCLGCDLKKSDGAFAQCKVYGHKHALKLKDGRFISFLENDNAADLIKGEKWHGKEVEVHGVFFSSANMLDVETYKVTGKTFGWCAGHKAMDQCHSGMGKEMGDKGK